MSKLLAYVLRYGPLVAALALGLNAVITPIFPAYAGILNSVLSALALFGVQPNQELVSLVGGVVAGVLALIGFGRKIIALVKAA